MTQPEALRLAAELEACPTINYKAHAAELRRLYNLLMDQQGEIYALKMARSMEQKTAALKQAALLEALKVVIDDLMYKDHARVIDVARAAIAKAEGEKT